MRAMRMKDLLAEGWIKKSGTTSNRAGMNGGAKFHSNSDLKHPILTAYVLRRHGSPLWPTCLLRRQVKLFNHFTGFFCSLCIACFAEMTSDFGGGGKNNKERLEYVKQERNALKPDCFMHLFC